MAEFETDLSARTGARVMRVDRADVPIQGISESLLARFRAGDELFEAMFREVDGLGPVYARASCGDCHAGDGRGPGLVMRVGRLDPNVSDERMRELLPFGDMERPYAIGAAKPLLLNVGPELKKSPRLPPPVFGRGYIEAVDDASIEAQFALARPGGSISGRIARIEDGPERSSRIGRFGLKARTADLTAFTAEALHGDMGLTSSRHPEEPSSENELTSDGKPGIDVSDEQVAMLADYVRLLALPPRISKSDREGALLFAQLDCSGCHVPSLRTRANYPIAQLADIDAPLYSDLLLHDMGEELSDGIKEGAAEAREWRTAPLIGLRFQNAFLHDGRASSVEEAILLHGGADSEGGPSKAAFVSLDRAQQQALVRFVQGL